MTLFRKDLVVPLRQPVIDDEAVEHKILKRLKEAF